MTNWIIIFNLSLIFLLLGSLKGTADNESITQDIVKTNYFQFTPDCLTNDFAIRTFYPSNFYVNITLQNLPAWLNSRREDSTNAEKTVKFTFSLKTGLHPSHDLIGNIRIRQEVDKDEFGNPGFFDEEKVSEGMPIDCTLLFICFWDPAKDSIYDVSETNKYAYISSETLNTAQTNNFILFKEIEDIKDNDKDYYLLIPRQSSYQIWTKNKKEGNRSLTLKVIQNNEIKATANIPKSDDFVKALICENLSTNNNTYALIEYEGGSLSNNVSYNLTHFVATPIEESLFWGSMPRPQTLSASQNSIMYSFKPLDDEMAIEFSFDNDTCYTNVSIDILNKQLNSITNNSTILEGKVGEKSFPSIVNDRYFKRYYLNNLDISNTYFAAISLNQQSNVLIEARVKISRIRPVFLVHGIDACPRYDGDSSFFGNLIDATQYYNIRPYRVYDFPWTSYDYEDLFFKSKGILGYVGKRDGTLGKFIIDRRTHNDLKATIVAHSMGCLLTYYQCNNSEIPFRQIVDNIVLTAPPFFGSSAANSANFPIVNWLTPFFKRTSRTNFQLLSRTTEHVWYRYKNPFVFDKSMMTVIIGTRKYIEINEAFSSTVDSLYKIKSPGDLFDSHKFFDAFVDVGLDGVEAFLELMSHLANIVKEPLELETFTTSELFYKNRSDSAVGTYSANIQAQDSYHQIKSVFIDDIHSNLQKFQESNPDFVNAVIERINNKGD